MNSKNRGFDPAVIDDYRAKMKAQGHNFYIDNAEDNSDEFVSFYFIGVYEGKEVVYDAALYTLRLHHNSELYEIAEHKAANRFPEYESIKYEEDENGDLAKLDDKEEEIGLFMAEVILELEEEDAVKVQEHVELDAHLDFGIGLDACLNVEKIDDTVIEKFVNDFNDDNLKLDETLYSFQTEDYELS